MDVLMRIPPKTMAKIVATTLIQKRKVKSGNFPALDPILIHKFAGQILEIYFSDLTEVGNGKIF